MRYVGCSRINKTQLLNDNFFPYEQIAAGVEQGKLRPRPTENEEFGTTELIELINCMWDGDASARPSFRTITCTLRKVQDKLSASL